MNSSRKLYEKNTTFTRKPGLPQIASYLVFALQTILFYAVVLPRLDPSPQIALGILYTITLLGLVISTIAASSCDPSDRVMVQYRNGSRQEFQQFRKTNPVKLLFCDYCRSFVKDRSRHCRACDRCVQDFDHHCMWINNCVGGLNYRAFFVMILAAFSNLLLYVLAMIILTVQSNTSASNFMAGFAVAWVSGGINSIFVLLLVNLILLHIYLFHKGISTYEFIMAQREQQRKQKQVDQRQKELPRIDSQTVSLKQENQGPNERENYNGHVEVKDEDSSSDNVVRVRSVDKKQDDGSSSSISQHQRREKQEQKPQPRASYNHKSVIFGHDGLTQKSQNWQAEQKAEAAIENQGESQAESSVQLSQLFTRNKSLKFIIGKNQFYRPHRTSRQHVRESKSKSMYVRQ